jgi:phage shock protein PspC (stress-responsive transcriptional regulator)
MVTRTDRRDDEDVNDAPPSPPRDPVRPGTGRLVREPDDAMVTGLCSGLADWLGLDVRLVRAAAVILTLVTPWTMLAYFVAGYFVPERGPGEPRVRAEPVGGLGDAHPVVVVVGIVLAAVLVDDAWFLRPFPAAVALVALGIWLLTRDRSPWAPRSDTESAPSSTTTTPTGPIDDTLTGDGTPAAAGWAAEPSPPGSDWWPEPAAEPPPRSRLSSVLAALLVLAAGVLWLLDSIGAVDVSWRGALAVGLLAVGGALLLATWWGRAAALVPVGLLLAFLLVVDEMLDVPLDAGIGDRDIVVDTRRELDGEHELLMGDMTLDLTAAPLARTGTTEIDAAVGLGELLVVVPEDARVTVDSSVRAGGVDWPGGAGTSEEGADIDRAFALQGEPGGPRLHLDLSVGFGTLEVVRG